MNKNYRIAVVSVFILFYVFLFSGYLYQYYFRWPVYGAEAWGTSNRDLTKFINDNKKLYNNVYIANSSNRVFLLQYAMFAQTDPKIVQSVWMQNPIHIDNITMIQGCLHKGKGDTRTFLPKSTLYISLDSICHYSNPPSLKILDRGERLRTIWNIYENN